MAILVVVGLAQAQINKSRHALKTSSSSPSRGSDGAKASFPPTHLPPSYPAIEEGEEEEEGVIQSERPADRPTPHSIEGTATQNFFPGLIMNR